MDKTPVDIKEQRTLSRNRLTDQEYEKLSQEYEQNPAVLSGNQGFLTTIHKRIEDNAHLTPVSDEIKSCPIRGICADGKLSSYAFMERKKTEKEYE